MTINKSNNIIRVVSYIRQNLRHSPFIRERNLIMDKKAMITVDSFKDGKMLVEKGKKKKLVVELV